MFNPGFSESKVGEFSFDVFFPFPLLLSQLISLS
uniref:Uncharacterized protein n=1 Tax=Rhizophora mucronata TaxID=61149 RepID=A0A2P2N9U6_RHIMU